MERDPDERRVCRHLKTKMMYVAGREEATLDRPSGTAGYWCLHTMAQMGPDDGLVVPDRCLRGRGCWEEEGL